MVLMGFAIIASYFSFASKRSSIGRITVTTGLAIGIVVLLCQIPTYAQGRPGPGGPGGPRKAGFAVLAWLVPLDLTEGQRVQVKDVMELHRAGTATMGKQLRTLQGALKNAVDTYPLNETLVRNAANVLNAAQTEMVLLRARIRSDVYGILTPEQQRRDQELRSRREALLKQGKDRVRERGRRPKR